MSSGGARSGAGRKSGRTRVAMTLSVAQETKQRAAALRQKGIRLGRLFDAAVYEATIERQGFEILRGEFLPDSGK